MPKNTLPTRRLRELEVSALGLGCMGMSFGTRALEHGPSPSEVTTDGAAAYPRVLDELVPAACHITEQYTNNPVEADHGRLKARLAADAWAETASFGRGDQYWARLRPEPPTRPL